MTPGQQGHPAPFPSHRIPSSVPLPSPPAHAFPHPVHLLPGFVSSELRFPSHCTKGAGAHPACFLLVGLLLGCSELGEGSLEPNTYLHRPRVLLVAPTRHGCPKFPFFPPLISAWSWQSGCRSFPCLALAACAGPPPGRVHGHRGKCSNTWLLLILLKTRKSIQNPPGVSRWAECVAALVAGAHVYLDWSLLRVFLAKHVHVPHHTWGIFGHTLLLEVTGRSALCCSRSDVIFASSSYRVIPSGLHCWGSTKAGPAGTTARPSRGELVAGHPVREHPQHFLCSSTDRRLALRQQRRLGALHRAGRDWCCWGNRCHRLRVERKKCVALLRKWVSGDGPFHSSFAQRLERFGKSCAGGN